MTYSVFLAFVIRPGDACLVYKNALDGESVVEERFGD
jgi:hypothetical protein